MRLRIETDQPSPRFDAPPAQELGEWWKEHEPERTPEEEAKYTEALKLLMSCII